MSSPNTSGPGAVTKIRQHLRDTLNGITVDEGYSISLATDVQTLEGSQRAHGKARIVSNGCDWSDGADGAGQGLDTINWNFDIWVEIIIPEKADEVDPEELQEAVADDIRIKVLQDVQRGGDAIDTKLTGWRPRDDGEYGVIVSGYCMTYTPFRSPRN